jgi:uncharacterized protein YbjT (DUF2867 family)
MRILVIGASRGIGLEAVRQGLARGHHIRALARSADRIASAIGAGCGADARSGSGSETDPGAGAEGGAEPGAGAARLEPHQADAADAGAVRAALEGVDAVIHTIGGPRGLRPRMAPVSLFSDTTATLLAEMHRANDGAGVRRLVAVTGFGAGDSRARLSLPERLGHRLLLGPPYDDKDRQEVLIRASGLDWLIVRPTILTNGPRTGRYQVLVEPRSWRNGLISRADVADYLVDQATQPSLSQATPVLAY